MSMDQSGWNEPQKKKSGVLKWVLLGCGGLLILVAAGAGIIAYLTYRAVNRDPVEAQAAAQDILPIEIPEGFTGGFSMNMMGMKMATLTTPPGSPGSSSSIVLMTFPSSGRTTPEEMRKQVDDMSRRGGGATFGNGSAERRVETFRLRGVDIEGQVESGNRDGRASFVQYTFVLTGKAGEAGMLMVNGNADRITHAWVQNLLDSVK